MYTLDIKQSGFLSYFVQIRKAFELFFFGEKCNITKILKFFWFLTRFIRVLTLLSLAIYLCVEFYMEPVQCCGPSDVQLHDGVNSAQSAN